MPEELKPSSSFRFYHGRSMRTTFQPGDCIIFEKIQIEKLRKGDVIVFSSESSGGEDVVHRIIGIGENFFEVKGDDNPADVTEVVPFQRVLGRVIAVEREGRNRKPVTGGKLGLLRAGLVAKEGIPGKLMRWGYSCLRQSGIVRLFWKPAIETLEVATDAGSVVRLVSGGKTIGKWCRKREILVLKKPWDLVVRVKDIKRQL
jgi:hypothetical protein